MAGYTLQGKTTEGSMVDIPLAATYDSAGNDIIKTYATKAQIDAINNTLADLTYKTPTIASFTLTGDTSAVDLTSDKLTRTITGFSHNETNIENFDGQLTFSGENKEQKVNPSSGSKAETLTQSITVTFSVSKKTATFTLKGTDKKKQAISKTAAIATAYFPMFYGALATTPTESTITGLKKKQGTTGSVSITYNNNDYVWFCSTDTINKVTSSGFNVPITKVSTLSFKGATYNLYRTEKLNAGTQTFVI